MTNTAPLYEAAGLTPPVALFQPHRLDQHPGVIPIGRDVAITEVVPGVRAVYYRTAGQAEPYWCWAPDADERTHELLNRAAETSELGEAFDVIRRTFVGPSNELPELASAQLHCTVVTESRFGGDPDKPKLILTDVRLEDEWAEHRTVFAMAQLFELHWPPLLYNGPFAGEIVRNIAKEFGHFGQRPQAVVVEPVIPITDAVLGRVKLIHAALEV